MISEQMIMVLIGILVAILLVALLGGLYLARIVIEDRRSHRRDEPLGPPAGAEPEPEPLTEEEARAIDPENPPMFRRYNPQPGRPVIHCTCHDRPFGRGDTVLWWPIPDHPDHAVDLFCKETYGVVGR